MTEFTGLPLPTLAPPSVEGILAEASLRRDGYEWMAAAELYQQALSQVGIKGNASESARINGMVGDCFFKAAFQASSHPEFEQRMRMAEQEYDRARELHDESRSVGHSKLLKAKSAFAGFWLIKDDADGQRKALAECSSLAEEAAGILERSGDRKALAEARRDLVVYLFESIFLTNRPYDDVRKQLITIMTTGESGANDYESLGDLEGQLDCLWRTVLASTEFFDSVFSPSEIGPVSEKILALGGWLAKVSEKIGTPFAQAVSSNCAAFLAMNFEADPAKASRLNESGWDYAQKTGDSILTASIARWAAITKNNSASHLDDVEAGRKVLESSMKHCEDAVRLTQVSGYRLLRQYAYSVYGNAHLLMARFVETEAQAKRVGFQKALELTRLAVSLGDFDHESHYRNTLASVLYFLASVTEDRQEKLRLLEEALPITEAAIRAIDLRDNPLSTMRGAVRLTSSRIKTALSGIKGDPNTRVDLLRSAASDAQVDVELFQAWAESPAKVSTVFYSYQLENYGDILARLYSLSKETDAGRRAVRAYEEEIADLEKWSHIGRIPMVRWKVARLLDDLGDHAAASEAFKKSAEECKLAAQKVPGSRAFFEELAAYMGSWKLVEESRISHSAEKFTDASETYGKAASTLRATTTYNHLADHYSACAALEKGEALSRQEIHEEAAQSFQNAAIGFDDHVVLLKSRLSGVRISEEKQELENWLNISIARGKYCRSRVAIEEASLYDQREDEEASSTRYRSALGILRDLLDGAVEEQSKRELETLALFCEARAQMLDAEVKSSPELYDEAAELFTKIEKVSSGVRWQRLALANASICRALSHGAMFRRTRDSNEYSEIKKHLETAADYYQQANLEKAAHWTHATQRLFDSLVYMADAEAEKEPEKKTRFFHLAEKHLEKAAKLFDEAGVNKKKEEALRMLSRARDEKLLLLSPMEVLGNNPVVSETPVSPLSLIRDQPVGVERLEGTSIVGNMELSEKEVSVGSVVTMEMHVVNIGKAPAMLLKLENAAPEGLEIERGSVSHLDKGPSVDLKGKRLEYLKTHEVKVPIRAKRKGAFELRPRVLFVDENGNYRSYEFEPIALIVKELGISGWLKGPG